MEPLSKAGIFLLNGIQLLLIVNQNHIHAGFIPVHQLVQLLQHIVRHVSRVFYDQILAYKLICQRQNPSLIELLSRNLCRLIFDPQLAVYPFQRIYRNHQARLRLFRFYHQMASHPIRRTTGGLHILTIHFQAADILQHPGLGIFGFLRKFCS